MSVIFTSKKYDDLMILFYLHRYTFLDDEPTDAQLKAAQELIKCGVQQNRLTPNYHLVGHRQLIATASPGRNLYRIIRGWPNFLANPSILKNFEFMHL